MSLGEHEEGEGEGETYLLMKTRALLMTLWEGWEVDAWVSFGMRLFGFGEERFFGLMVGFCKRR